jgi:hypothetical protein
VKWLKVRRNKNKRWVGDQASKIDEYQPFVQMVVAFEK